MIKRDRLTFKLRYGRPLLRAGPGDVHPDGDSGGI